MSQVRNAPKKRYEEYKIIIENRIMDNVHGLVGLTKVEDEIERLPIFKRLHYISQLGLVQRIFPCALHTRYIHSLGVLHVADLMAQTILLDENERQVLRLAALLHDIGHYPFSHDIEMVYKDNSITDNTKNSDNIKSPLKKIDSVFKEKALSLDEDGNGDSLHHEKIGQIIVNKNIDIFNIVKEHYVKNNVYYKDLIKIYGLDKTNELVLNDIGNIIIGNMQYNSLIFKDRFSLLVQMLHSEMDADNIDYLLRDATFSGTSYGSMDMGLLISHLCYKKCQFNIVIGESTEERTHYILGVNPKGILSAEQFLFNRYLAYNQVIHHKYTSILGSMLRNVITWAITDANSGFIYSDISSIVNKDVDRKYANWDKFIRFTDYYLLQFINSINTEEWNSGSKLTKKIIGYLKDIKSINLEDADSDNSVVVSSRELIDAQATLKTLNIYNELVNLNKEIEIASAKTLQKDEIEKLQERAYKYDVETKELSKQISLKKVEELLKNVPENDHEQILLSRLLNGIAVIKDNEIMPKLLIDDFSSHLSILGEMQYIKIRKYKTL